MARNNATQKPPTSGGNVWLGISREDGREIAYLVTDADREYPRPIALVAPGQAPLSPEQFQVARKVARDFKLTAMFAGVRGLRNLGPMLGKDQSPPWLLTDAVFWLVDRCGRLKRYPKQGYTRGRFGIMRLGDQRVFGWTAFGCDRWIVPPKLSGLSAPDPTASVLGSKRSGEAKVRRPQA